MEKPTHWKGLDELDAKYWEDGQAQTQRDQEFFEKPEETLAALKKADSKGLARREFLTIMGASMAMATLACSRRPVNKIIPYVVKPEEVTPGVANWYASTEPETGAGLLIKTREGRPIKLEGNPDHPMNRGSISARSQASLLDLYDTDRLKKPLQVGSDGAVKQSTWEEVDKLITAELKRQGGSSGRVAILSRGTHSFSGRRLVSEFLAAFSRGAHYEYEPTGLEEVAEAQQASYGTSVVPCVHFDKADVVVSLGADFLGNWGNSNENSRRWSQRRKLKSQNPGANRFSKFYCFESMMTSTGSSADERFSVRPGDELKVGLAIVHELVIRQGKSAYAGSSQLKAILKDYSPQKVAKEIGGSLTAAKIQEVATQLWGARGRGAVVAGGLSSKTKYSVGLQVTANLLNTILGNEGKTIDGTAEPVQPRGSASEAIRLTRAIRDRKVSVLIINGANPVYDFPKDLDFAGALKQVPMVISIADRLDETARLSHFVLPNNHYLENWGDADVKKGVFSIQQPAIAPLHDSRSFENSLLTWIRQGKLGATGMAARVANASKKQNTWYHYLRRNWNDRIYPRYGGAASFNDFWVKTLQKGVVDARARSASARSFRSASFKYLPAYPIGPVGITLALYSKNSMGNGTQANNSWLQELPDGVSTVAWDNYVNVAPSLAKTYGLKQNDVARLTSDSGSTVEAPVNIQPGMHPNVVSLAVGYGRTSVGGVGNNVGVNAYPFVRLKNDRVVFSGEMVKMAKTGKRYELAATQMHHRTTGRPIVNDISYDDFLKNPAKEDHTDPHLRMEDPITIWPKHEYKGYRWGMAVDLNSCTGCGSCIVACQAENNIPVVGRENVRKGREMHWIRIDRYYSGSEDQPDVTFQPMMCQHCENASCETVCPVLATVHDDEGLNQMVYNRCVGTRYCQNNCPYKVRRFNYFDHWKEYTDTKNLVWNPDITVRTRGIMEKCSFCIQRIQEARGKAKDEGRKIRDGDVITACQQTCSSDAIVFGDINDPNSKVSKLRADARAYRVLETINNKPMVSYLTKVRNKKKVASHNPDHNGGGNGHH